MPTFTSLVALNQQTGQLIKNAAGSVYDPSDTSFSTPLSVTTPDGVSRTDVRVLPQGITEQFDTGTGGLLTVVWKSAGLPAIVITSYDAVLQAVETARDAAQAARAAAEAAQAAAEDAAATAQAPAEDAVLSVITDDVDTSGPITDKLSTEFATSAIVESLAVNVKDAAYGAVGDGVTDDTAAIQAAIDAAGQGSVFFPSGVYIVSGPGLTVSTGGLTMRGAGRELSQIVSSTGDVLTINALSQFVTGIEFRSDIGGGHVVVTPSGVGALSQSHFTACGFIQRNDAKSCWFFEDLTSAGGGFFDCHWSDCIFQHRETATVPGFYVRGSANCFSANRFHRCRAHSSNAEPFFDIGTTALSTSNYSNSWDSINFEVCNGGGIRMRTATNTGVHNVGFFDNGDITGNLIEFGRLDGAGQSQGNRVTNFHRSGGTLIGEAKDIVLPSTQNRGTSVFDGITGPPVADLKIDVGSNSGYAVVTGYDQGAVTVENANADRTVLITAELGISTPALTVAGTPVTGVRAASADAFDNAAHAVNTDNKKLGRPAYDITASRPVWATGGATTSTWVFADGTTAHTPA